MKKNIILFGGNFSQKVIKPVLLRLNNNIKFEITKSIQNNKIFTSNLNSILSDNKIDTAVIAVPPSENLRILNALVNYSSIKNIFVEKPLSNSLLNAQKIKKIILSNKINFFVDYSFNYFAPFIHFKKLISDQKIISYSVIWNSKTRQNFKLNFDSWKNKRADGGGGLNNFGSHIISLLINFFGDISYIDSKLFNLNDPFSIDEFKGEFFFEHTDVKGFFNFDIFSDKKSCFEFKIKTLNHNYTLSCFNNDYFNDYNIILNNIVIYSYKNIPDYEDSRMPIIENSLKSFFNNHTYSNFYNALKTQDILEKLRKKCMDCN